MTTNLRLPATQDILFRLFTTFDHPGIPNELKGLLPEEAMKRVATYPLDAYHPDFLKIFESVEIPTSDVEHWRQKYHPDLPSLK